jgi:DNA-binding CsgD family transcriptional regulator
MMNRFSFASRRRVCIRWVIVMNRSLSRAQLLKQVRTLRKRIAAIEPGQSDGRSQSEVEIALRERIKELDCLYTISTLSEMHFQYPERFLQSVVDCLPKSWLYPEHACARISYADKQYITEDFVEGKWRMASDIVADGRIVGVVEVFYRKVVPTSDTGPFLKEEYALIRAVAERVSSVMMHMKALADLRVAHRAIQREQQALQEANIALRAVLSRLEEEKHSIKASIAANIQKVIMPIVFELELEVTGRQRSYATLLRRSLQEITSPFLTQIARDHVQLTPVEIAISTMIRNGLSTKEIAQLRCISPATVRRHRENIRRKLGLRNRKANLATFLQASVAGESTPVTEIAAPPADQVGEEPAPFKGWQTGALSDSQTWDS